MSFKIPAGVLAQHMIAIGKTGSGKSSKLRVFVEQLLRAGEPVIILDVKGDWWGIKSSANGKEPGFPVVIFGGKRADLPLNAAAGKELAEVVCSGNRPCVIDMRGLSHRDRSQFFIDFVSTAYRINKGKRYIVISEVHNFAFKGKVFSPQAGEMLHWANTLASEGRGLGLTVLADSQRGQKVHNDFLTSMETLIACKVIHKSDRDAIKDWIDGCADIEVGKQVLASLAQLKKPEAWVWCPEIDYGPERVTFPLFSTFDSFKPQELDAPAQLKGWATVDLEELKGKLVTVLEEAKANDPAALKKRIADLEREIRTAKPVHRADPIVTMKITEVEAKARERGRKEGFEEATRQMTETQVRARHQLSRRLHAEIDSSIAGMSEPILPYVPPTHDRVEVSIQGKGNKLLTPKEVTARLRDGVALTSVSHPKGNGKAPPVRLKPSSLETIEVDLPLSGVQQKIVDALAELEQIGSASPPRELLCFMAGYQNVNSKGFANAIGQLRTGGLIAGMTLTDAGRAAAHPSPAPRTPAELQNQLMALLGGATARILKPLLDTYPDALTRDHLVKEAGYENKNSKGFANALGRLRTLGFIDYPRDRPGTVIAKSVLFLE